MRNTGLAFLLVFLIPVAIPACHNTEAVDMGPADMAMPPADMTARPSQCGHPGDKGNSLGVGMYCTEIADCVGGGRKTNLCSSLGNGPTPSPDDTYFCTIYPCHLDGGADQCGENATCSCGSGGGGAGCACTPNRCIGSPPDGGP